MLLWRFCVAGNNKTCAGFLVKCPIFLIDFTEIFNFLDRFFFKSPISNFAKIRPVGAELMFAERLTDGRTETHDGANRRVSGDVRVNGPVHEHGIAVCLIVVVHMCLNDKM